MNFYLGLPHTEIAEQIAGLLNTYNRLAQRRMAPDILQGRIDYVVELHGKLVIGACGLEKQSHSLSEMKHLVVRPDWRGKGVGKYVAQRALNICDSPMVYSTVRADNESSLRLLASLDFQKAGQYPAEGHEVILLVRTSPKWKQQKPDWKSVSSTGPIMGSPETQASSLP